MNDRQTYRLRAPASGREAIAVVDENGVYVDSVSGEEMEPVTRTLHVADCPYCGKRQEPLGEPA